MNIYPSVISKDEFHSNAEYKLYKHAIESGMFGNNSRCFLFHSVKNPTPGNFKLIGETDFIYLDRDIILFIEVKGGQVKYDSLTNKWWVMNGSKEKDPFAQAASNLFNYRDIKLPELLGGKNEVRRLVFGYCVFFPDCTKPDFFTSSKIRNIEYDPRLIIDYEDFETKTFDRIINELTSYWKNHETYRRINPTGISVKELFKIKNFIRKDLVFEFPWTDLLKRNDEKFKRYTDDAQQQLLMMLEDNSRMGAIVKGGAGTGKTWLALEYAKRLDLAGKKVLFLCFNRNLAYYLKRQLAFLEANDVKVLHKDAFYNEMLKREFNLDINQLKEEWSSNQHNQIDSDFWNKEIPLRITQVFKDYHCTKYDFIIMDEAQDYFSEYHIDAISCFLIGGFESGKFMICMDNETQDFFLENNPEFEDYFRSVFPSYVSRLKKNCRNPQMLSDTAYYLTGLSKQDCYFKEAVKSSELKYYSDNKDLKNKILSFVEQKKNENISFENITILCYDNRNIENIIRFKPSLFCKITEHNLFSQNKIMISTAQSFKGLENQFILFVGPASYVSDSEIQKKIIFNAFTRARYQFVYLIDEKYKSIVDNEFAANIID